MKRAMWVGVASFAVIALALAGCDSNSSGGGADSVSSGGGNTGGGDSVGGGGGVGDGGGGGAVAQCTESNPYAGSCWETFVTGCFDPSGKCTVTTAGTVTWENGAKVETKAQGIGAESTGTSSNGTVCYTGTTTVDITTGTSNTKYTNNANETVTFASKATADGKATTTVTCPDGSTFTVTPEQSSAASSCQYGGTEPCTMESGGGGGGGGGGTGACQVAGDCSGGMQCCDVNGTKFCLPQCP